MHNVEVTISELAAGNVYSFITYIIGSRGREISEYPVSSRALLSAPSDQLCFPVIFYKLTKNDMFLVLSNDGVIDEFVQVHILTKNGPGFIFRTFSKEQETMFRKIT